ncbi:MAG: PadR family transcriptional regulator [Chloroflexota bacterium]
MSYRTPEEELGDAKQRAQEAREAWRRARSELREAVRRTRAESKHHEDAQQTARGDEIDETLEDIATAAREFATEVGEEARRMADDLWRGARHEWHGRWRDQWQKNFGKDWQRHWVFGGRRFRQWSSGAEEVNPFVGAILSRGGGLLAVYVLHLLAEQPRHGNDVMRQIEQRTMGSWASNPGAIYPLLSFMEEKGFVESQWEDPDKRTRRIYHITEEGRREEERLRQVLRPKVMEAIEVLHVLYDDLYGGPEEGSPSGGEPESTSSTPEGGEPEPPTPADDEYRAQATVQEPDEPGWRRRLGRLFGGGEDQFAFGR